MNMETHMIKNMATAQRKLIETNMRAQVNLLAGNLAKQNEVNEDTLNTGLGWLTEMS